MIAFLGTQNNNFDFVLFLVPFWSHRHISKQCFLYFCRAFFVHFMSWSACGFHLLHVCFFESWKTKFWFRIVFSSIFEPWAHLETVSFHIVFLVFWANVVSSSECHLHSLHDCFFEHFEPWSPLETISYPDLFQLCYANVISWLAFGIVYLWEHKTRKRWFRMVF